MNCTKLILPLLASLMLVSCTEKQAEKEAANALTWLGEIAKLGENALAEIDVPAFVKWLGEKLNIPTALFKSSETKAPFIPLSQTL